MEPALSWRILTSTPHLYGAGYVTRPLFRQWSRAVSVNRIIYCKNNKIFGFCGGQSKSNGSNAVLCVANCAKLSSIGGCGAWCVCDTYMKLMITCLITISYVVAASFLLTRHPIRKKSLECYLGITVASWLDCPDCSNVT